MLAPGRAAFLAAAGWLACGTVLAADAPRIAVTDELGTDQVDEAVTIWSSNQALGTLHVNRDRPADRVLLNIPPGLFTYALCGVLHKKQPDGTVSVITIDNAGQVPVQPGDTLRLMTIRDEAFVLESPAGDHAAGPSRVCSQAIS